MRALPILWLCVSVGCVSQLGGWTHATGEQLTRRASFDLDCASGNLRYNRIDSKTQGVVGCGKHATYVEQCSKVTEGADTECTWVLNGVIESPTASGPGGTAPASQ